MAHSAHPPDDPETGGDGSGNLRTVQSDGRATAQNAIARLDDLSRLLPEWLWETDDRLRLTFIGMRILDVLQYHPSAYIGRPLEALFGSDIRVSGAAEPGKARPFRDREVTVADRFGAPRVLVVAGLPVFDPDTGRFAGYRGVARDVTETKAQARALEEAKAAAERANRAKSEFLATMSHELRTPLNAVIGFADVLQGEHFGSLGHAKYLEYAADIVASGRHLAQLIDDVLDMAKIEAGRLELHEEHVEPKHVMDCAVRMVKPKADEAGVRLSLTYPPDHVGLRVDRQKLLQILINLLTNAVKFTDQDGRVALSAWTSVDGGFAFAVTDTGIGMSADEQAVALEPFGQVNGQSPAGRQGTGLGLSIVKALTELHGGTLTIDSAPGEGSAITVSLPPDRVADSR
jgi:signal transduction histidine kinase